MFTPKQRCIMDVLNTAFPPGTNFNSGLFYSKLHLQQHGIAFEEVTEICRSLEAEGCISHLLVTRSGLVDNLRIETRGRDYKEFERLENQAKWKERLWGFLVGAVTATIPWLLGLIRLSK